MTEIKENINEEFLEELKGIKKELNGIKHKDFKQVISIIIAIILSLIIGLGLGVYCGIHKDDIMMKINPKSYAQSTITVLEKKIDEESKLNTGLYYQKSHFDSGNDYKKLFKQDLKWTKKHIAYDYDGTVEAGIKDLSKTKVEVDTNNGIIKITLPAIQITNISINSNSINNIDQTNNWLNQLSMEDFNNAYKIMEKQLEKDALNNGLIEKAQENAEKTLTRLFGDTTTGYTVEFIWE